MHRNLFNKLKRYLIAGTGVTGISAARYLLAQDYEVILLDTRENPEIALKVREALGEVKLYQGDLSEYSFTENDVLVVSPGISLQEVFIKEALDAGAIISSDVELFEQAIIAKQGAIDNLGVVAVTGSNGKSTVVSLLEYVLNEIGVSALAAGNIGLPVLDALKCNVEVFVLELSSFQLERLDQFHSDVACILNLSEDHMDRYDSFKDYAQAKQIIYKSTKSAVFNADDEWARPLLDICDSLPSVNCFSKKKSSSVALSVEELLERIDVKRLHLKGSHNLENIAAVWLIIEALFKELDKAFDEKALISAIQSFKGLPHRCEYVASKGGVDYINDSKATNVGAALAAIDGLAGQYNKIILLLGGVDKHSDFSELVDQVRTVNAAVVIYGQDASTIEKSFEAKSYPFETANVLADAYYKAIEIANDGDAVLLAPACASFDEFENYMARGDYFSSLVHGGVQ